MRKSISDLEFLRQAHAVYENNQTLMNYIREQDNHIKKLKETVDYLDEVIIEYEKESFAATVVNIPDETVALIPNEQKNCCSIL